MNTSESKIVLYGVQLSGHTHRIMQLLHILDLRYEFVDAPAEYRRNASFLEMNPLGQIPVLVDDGLVLCDSNAIMVYLIRKYAADSALLPDEPVAAAQVQRWLSIAAGEIKYGPAAARVAMQWGDPSDALRPTEIAARLFAFMEQHLSSRQFLAAEHVTLADLACYAYVAHAPEGGISLAPYPNLRAWLARVQAMPRFVALPSSPIKSAT